MKKKMFIFAGVLALSVMMATPVLASETSQDGISAQALEDLSYGSNQVYDETTGDWKWVFADENGAAVTTEGWQKYVYSGDESYYDWYYVGADGYLYTDGIYKINGNKYCFYYSGEMATGSFGYYDENDEYQYGLAASNGVIVEKKDTWYKYVDQWGNVAWYYFGADGSLYRNGIYTVDGKKYYFGYGGEMASGPHQEYDHDAEEWVWKVTNSDSTVIEAKNTWVYYDGGETRSYYTGWYYLDKNGILLTNGFYTVNGKKYYFNYDGQMETGLFGYWDDETETYVYCVAAENGTLLENSWYQDEYGIWYYAKSGGILARSEIYKVNGKEYYFDYGGEMCTGMISVYDSATDSYEYLLAADNGVIIRGNGWYKYDNDWYYFNSDGTLVDDGIYTISGKQYGFIFGKMMTGEFGLYDEETDNYRYYLADASGVVINDKTGWYKYNTDWYYFKSKGVLAQNELLTINGKTYYFIGASMAVGYIGGDGASYITDNSGAIAKNGWVKYGYEWYYASADGSLLQNEWKQIGSAKYYLDDYGAMATGYVMIDGSLHQFKDNGVYVGKFAGTTGWQKLNGLWYYFKEAGVAYTGWVDNTYYIEDGMMVYHTLYELGDDLYLFDNNGKKITGWYKFEYCWYYGNADGTIANYEWKKINGNWYYFQYHGRMVTGINEIYNENTNENELHRFTEGGVWLGKIAGKNQWVQYDGCWCYFDENGDYLYGPDQEINGVTYHFSSDGIMEADTVVESYKQGKDVYVNASGKETKLSAGWHQIDGDWIYVDKNGDILKGLQTINGKTYYLAPEMLIGMVWVEEYNKYCFFGDNGAMQTVTTGWYKADGEWYYVKDGVPVTGFQTIDGKEYYFVRKGWMVSGTYYTMSENSDIVILGENGLVAKNQWVKLYGDWYYADANGKALRGTHVINGKTYIFDINGRML